MLIRIVKLTFKPEEVLTFKSIFERQKEKIRAAAGCKYLSLLQERENECVFMTYSHWESAQDLENYRNSELFKSTWAETKVLFGGKPEAWSMIELVKIN